MYIDMLGLSLEHSPRSIPRGWRAEPNSFSLPASRETAGRQEKGLSEGQSTEVNSRKLWLVLWIDVCWLTHVLHAFERETKKREPKTEKTRHGLAIISASVETEQGIKRDRAKNQSCQVF